MSEGYDRLQDALDGMEPAGFERCDDDELGHLADLVRRARDEHARALHDATEESLRHVPRLARPAVRRIVGL